MNYISPLFFFFVLCLLPVGIGAQDTVFVTDATLTNGNYHWTADKLYVLRDMVGLDSGGVLTIDAGTVIKADVEQFPYPESGLGLIVARGAKIYANGTAAAPIIFTATSDNLDDPTDLGPRDHGLWDGLMILGRARIATESGESYLNFREPFISRWPYGGDDDEDSSGSLRYVSVRHAGSLGHYLAGGSVAFLGVGRGTVVDHVES
ncbi:MAG: T9SS C-terminal target domain-containing protein, partial [Bacteroidota bacterium]